MESSLEERIWHQFDAFCKKVLKFEARNIYHERERQKQREVSLTELSESQMEHFFTVDDYFADEQQFHVLDFHISVQDELLTAALLALPEDRRHIVLLSYFLGMSDGEISKLLQIVRKTVQYRRTSSLLQLKKYLEGKK